MRYVILGAGAVGATIGGLLHQAGVPVRLLARGEHAAAMRRSGLTLATPAGTSVLGVDVVDDPARLELNGSDVLVTTTKTQHTTGLLEAVAGQRLPSGGWAADELPVVCAQNGVANERIALRRFRRVYGVCVMLPASQLEPGRVEAQGAPFPGMLDVGRYPSGLDAVAEEVAIDLTAAGFLSIARADVMRWKYAKLLRNLGNAVEALCGQDDDERGGGAANSDGAANGDGGTARRLAAEVQQRATAEGRAVLAGAGIDVVDPAVWQAYRRDHMEVRPIDGRTRRGGSSWQSASKQSGSIEADYLNGEIGLLGRLHGMATPVNDLLQSEANALARERRAPGSVTAADLLSRLGA